jgi:20S proteasome alpha/beta subunit
LVYRYFEKAIEVLMYEENYEFFSKLDVTEAVNIIVELLKTAFVEMKQSNDDEELIKVLYKLEILVSYDSP